MCKIEELLIENPVIAAIRSKEDLKRAMESKSLITFVLYGNIMNIRDTCLSLKQSGKIVFIHVDMIDGLKGDYAGLEFIKKFVEPAGIITTKPANIRYAKQLQMYAIQRIFAIDSLSLKTGIKSIQDTSPNAVEVMPGVSGKIIKKLKQGINEPVIAGGLIDTKSDIMEALSQGALAISTTSKKLWNQ